jgi:uncharacterized repeat protein (TIGR03943 family)
VSGFVTHIPGWPDEYFMITRFVLTCCAADAYPVGLPVELPPGTERPKPDTWLEVGHMTTHHPRQQAPTGDWRGHPDRNS